MSVDLDAAVEGHCPIKAGSSVSNIPGGYTGDWLICSCDPKDLWNQMAERIPIAAYPAHLLIAAAPLIEAQVRESVFADLAVVAHRLRVSKRPGETQTGYALRQVRAEVMSDAARIVLPPKETK